MARRVLTLGYSGRADGSRAADVRALRRTGHRGVAAAAGRAAGTVSTP